MKAFIVLGMHRSATSLIAKGLYENGVSMGDNLLMEGMGNPYGHYEDKDFISLNDRILRAAGGSWDNPPDEKKIISAGRAFTVTIRALIARKQKDLWGFKDPRTVLTIRCYLPFLKNAHFITCFRGHKEVAESLYKRNRIPEYKGIALAKEYNRRLINFLGDWNDINSYTGY